MKLTKLKLSKDIYFGDYHLSLKRNIKEEITYTGIVKPEGETKQAPEIATTIFSQVLKQRKKSVIITTHNSDLDLDKFYSKNQFKKLQKSASGDEKEKPHGIVHHKEPTAKQVIQKTREVIMGHDFSLSHFNIMEDSMRGEDGDSEVTEEEKIAAVIPTIDKWIDRVWKNVATNGLFVVLFGGHEANSNGVSMFNIKT